MAVNLITDVLKRRQPLDDAFNRLAGHEQFASLSERDRAFARTIAAATLRRKGQLADIVSRFIEKPLPEKRGRLDAILLTAAAQLVFLKSPPYAVINLAVFQVREDQAARRFSRLANAVLRRISEKGSAIASQQDEAKLNTPDWLWASWSSAYGPDEALKIAAQHLIEPPLDLTVKSDADGWAERLGGIALPTGSVRLRNKGRIEMLEGYADGAWWVQDAAAGLPAKLLGDVGGRQVADLCAAPGGKTAQLAAMGAAVTAVDISEKRIARLKENLARLKLEAETVVADVFKWEPDEPFDAILLDAPCSATGTIRRNPDIPYLKKAADIPSLAELQETMLAKALDLLKPGGTLVYCTCSLEPAEGPAQIRTILGRRDDIVHQPIEASEIAGRAEWLDNSGALRTLPHYLQLSDPDLSGMDGFYAARLVKTP